MNYFLGCLFEVCSLYMPSLSDDAYASQPLPTIYTAVRQFGGNASATFELAYEINAVAVCIDEVAALLRPAFLEERD